MALDCETSGLHWDDGAQLSCLSLAWRDSAGVLRTWGIPFDQGVRPGKHTFEMTPTQVQSYHGLLETEQTRGRILETMASKKRQDTKVYAELEAQLSLLDSVSWSGESEALWEEVVCILSEKQLVAHNAKFDIHMVWEGAPFGWRSGNLARRVVWDTMICARIIEPVDSAALDECAKRLGLSGKVGVESVQEWLHKMKLPKYRYDLVPWDVIREYVCVDTELTLLLYEDQHGYFEERGEGWAQEWGQFQREMDLMRALVKIESRGVGYDARRSRAEAVATDERADAMEAALAEQIGVGVGEGVTLPVMKAFWTEGGWADYFPKTATGAISATDEVITDLAGEVPLVEEWGRLAAARRMSSMYYTGYANKVGKDGRLRCTYRQHGARSGRLSVERVNLQAIPTGVKVEKAGSELGIRQLLSTQREGYGLYALDLSQAELRVATSYSKCARMRSLLEDDSVDMHQTTADLLSEVCGVKIIRALGKQANFGCLFGIGGEGFARLVKRQSGIGLAPGLGDDIVQSWRKLYPEFQQAAWAWERFADSELWVPQLIGTEYEVRSWFDLVGATGRTGRLGFDETRTAWNRVVQGSIGQFVRMWLTRLWKEDVRVVLTVHDSVYLELEDRSDGQGMEQAKHIASQTQEWATSLFDITLPCDVECYHTGY